MALLHHLRMQTPASQQEQPLRLSYRQQARRPLRLWHHGLRPEYPPLNRAFRPLVSEPQPPWVFPLPQPQEFRPLYLERELRQGCRQSSRALQADLFLEQQPRPLALLRPVQAHRYSRLVSQHESWPEYRRLTVLVQT